MLSITPEPLPQHSIFRETARDVQKDFSQIVMDNVTSCTEGIHSSGGAGSCA